MHNNERDDAIRTLFAQVEGLANTVAQLCEENVGLRSLLTQKDDPVSQGQKLSPTNEEQGAIREAQEEAHSPAVIAEPSALLTEQHQNPIARSSSPWIALPTSQQLETADQQWAQVNPETGALLENIPFYRSGPPGADLAPRRTPDQAESSKEQQTLDSHLQTSHEAWDRHFEYIWKKPFDNLMQMKPQNPEGYQPLLDWAQYPEEAHLPVVSMVSHGSQTEHHQRQKASSVEQTMDPDSSPQQALDSDLQIPIDEILSWQTEPVNEEAYDAAFEEWRQREPEQYQTLMEYCASHNFNVPLEEAAAGTTFNNSIDLTGTSRPETPSSMRATASQPPQPNADEGGEYEALPEPDRVSGITHDIRFHHPLSTEEQQQDFHQLMNPFQTDYSAGYRPFEDTQSTASQPPQPNPNISSDHDAQPESDHATDDARIHQPLSTEEQSNGRAAAGVSRVDG